MTQTNNDVLLSTVIEQILSKKGEDVAVLDLRGLLDVTDWFVIATGYSEIQVQTIADAVVDGTLAIGQKPLHVEGRTVGKWILVDYVDIVVHLMLPEERERYRLDRLWGDAPMTEYDETGTARLVRAPLERAEKSAADDGEDR